MLKSMGYEVGAFNWIPVASFSFVIFIANWGILTLPCLIIAEIMPEHVKAFGVSFCFSLIWFISFVVTKCLPFLLAYFGFHGTMFLFAANCLLSSVIIILFLPETKGKSYEQIMDMLQ